MSDSDVVVTEYRAEFHAAPFARPRWTITSGAEYRTTLPKRRRWTVVREYDAAHSEPARKVPDTGIGHIHESMLLDPDAVVVFIPFGPGSRFGHAVVIEQIARDEHCTRCGVRTTSHAELRQHVLSHI